VPCSKEVSQTLRTVYATIQKRLHKRAGECLIQLHEPSSRWYDHLLAILVYQGSYPMVPYQALVIRESAMLFLGFTPWGRKALSARGADPAGAYSPDSFDCTT
jgi:hypothetical protein